MKQKNAQGYLGEESISAVDETERNIQRKTLLIGQIKKDIFIKLFAFAAAMVILFTFVFGVTKATTNDMFPAIHEGDVVVYFRLGQLTGTDVAVYETDTGPNIGRVQAMPGSEVNKTEGGLLTIDGNIQPQQKRAGLYYETEIREKGRLEYPSRVPQDSYLILGDEREHANDSRTYGYIPKEKIKGKVFTIIRRRPL